MALDRFCMDSDGRPLVTDGPSLPSADDLVNRGAEFHAHRQVDVARMHFVSALLLNPDHPVALQNLSAALMCHMKFKAGISVARRAVTAAPANPHAKVNLAALLSQLGHFDEAKEIYKEILPIFTDNNGPWHNYGLLLHFAGQYKDAVTAYDKALSIKYDPNIVSDRAWSVLSSGDLLQGVRDYSVRWDERLVTKLYKSKIWESGVPKWDHKEPLDGKRLLVHHEQGFGDSIMLMRFIPQLARRAALVTVAVMPELFNLFQRADLDVIDWRGPIDPTKFDYHIPMLDIIVALGIERDVIPPLPYLSAKPWPNLGPAGYRIGICWASGDQGSIINLRRRYVPLELFFPISELPRVRLVSLQKGAPQGDIINSGAEGFIFDPTNLASDWADTAEIISGCDLIISVDSAVAHLAGALGKPTFMLGPFLRCWRWWGERYGHPWYNDFRIFKQEKFGDWEIPMAKMMDVLRGSLNYQRRIAA